MNVRLQTGGRLLALLGPGVVMLAAAIGLSVWARTEVTAFRYRVTHLLHREADLRSDVERLRIEVAALSSPERIEREARRLGLTHPRPGQLVLLFPRAERRP